MGSEVARAYMFSADKHHLSRARRIYSSVCVSCQVARIVYDYYRSHRLDGSKFRAVMPTPASISRHEADNTWTYSGSVSHIVATCEMS